MSVNGYEFTALTGGAAGALDSKDGSLLIDGDIAMVTYNSNIYWYRYVAGNADAESSPNTIAPDTNPTGRWKLQSVPMTNSIPVGCVIPFIGGYFSNGSNGGFTNVIGNDAATVNALVSGSGFRVCDGTALNLAGSSIFNGAGRYLPNLTDSRFLMGYSAAGSVGGNNSSAHSHSFDHAHTTGDCTLTSAQIPAHTHPLSGNFGLAAGPDVIVSERTMDGTIQSYITVLANTGGGAAHNHGWTSSVSANYGSAWTGGATDAENRPSFLSCLYIMKVQA